MFEMFFCGTELEIWELRGEKTINNYVLFLNIFWELDSLKFRFYKLVTYDVQKIQDDTRRPGFGLRNV